jgi:hypothetical protein
MAAIAYPKEPAKAQNSISCLPRTLVDHYVIDAPEFLARCIVDNGPINLAGGNKTAMGVGGVIEVGHQTALLEAAPLDGWDPQ